MHINKISGIIPSTTAWGSARSQVKPATTSSSIPSNSTQPLNSSVQIQSLSGPGQTATLAASCSTTAGGKNYSESVEELDGTYIASVPNPPAVSASGSSVQSAEANLNIILDALA